MTITTGMNPSLAVAQCDLVYDAEDDMCYPIKCFMRIEAYYLRPDRGVGFSGGWLCYATLLGCRIGDLVLGRDDAMKALGANVAYLERVAGEYEAERRNEDGAAA